jgi:hypothetical protein
MIYLSIVILAILGLMAYREYISYKERGELLSRIMSKNYAEFAGWQAQERIEKKIEKELKEPKSDTYVDPENMTDEDREKAIG